MNYNLFFIVLCTLFNVLTQVFLKGCGKYFEIQTLVKMQILIYYPSLTLSLSVSLSLALSPTVSAGPLSSCQLHPPRRLRHTVQPGQDVVLGQSVW